ncbi:Piwi domain containing protein [Rhypophila sp. PSN 637]
MAPKKNLNKKGCYGNDRNTNQGDAKPLTSKEIEDNTIEANKTIETPPELLPLPPRPGYNSKGTKTTLITNCFELQLANLPEFYRYHVKVERNEQPTQGGADPETAPKEPASETAQDEPAASAVPTTEGLDNMTPTATESAAEFATPTQDANQDLKATQQDTAGEGENDPFAHPKGAKLAHILYHFLNSNETFHDAVVSGKMASDFATTLVSTRKLEESEETSTIIYRGQKSKYRQDTYSVTLRLTNTISSQNTVDFLKGVKHPLTPQAVKQNLEMIQVLNILHRGIAKWHSFNILEKPSRIIIGHKTYKTPPEKTQQDLKFEPGIIAIPGFVSSIRPAAGRLLSNIQGTTGLFYKAGKLTDLMTDLCGSTNPDEPNLRKFNRFVKGVKVRLTYRDEKDSEGKKVRAIKTISGLAHKDDGKLSKGDLIGKALDPPLEFTDDAPDVGAKCNQIKFFRHERKKVTEPAGDEDQTSQMAKAKKRKPQDDEKKQPDGDYVFVNEYIEEYPLLTTSSQDYGKAKFPKDDFTINVGTRLRPEYVPMGCCEVIVGQNYRATLSGRQVAKMIELARKSPQENTDIISKDAADVLEFDRQKRITIPNRTLLRVTAQELSPGIVLYGPDTVARSHRWNMQNITIKEKNGSTKKVLVKYTTAGKLGPGLWGVLVVTDKDKALDNVKLTKVNATVKLIKEKLKDRGVTQTTSYKTELWAVSRAELGDKMETLCEAGKLWFVFVPDNFPLVEYKALKKMADVQLGIHTCCMNMSKKTADPQYCDNVLLKANLKSGGVNQTVEMPDKRIIDFDKTMVVGLDVTHPAPGAQGEQSIAAMVASTNSQLGQWPATMAQQQYSKDEVVFHKEGIKKLLTPHLTTWMAKRKKELPEQLLVYRDGVSEGQYGQVVEYECKHMREVCKEFYKTHGTRQKPPRITIVIVGKRHHMRFFKGSTIINGQLVDVTNPNPGTVVDRGVTSQYLWEFYLQAHEPIHGTARPAHYVVVVDDIFSSIKSTAFAWGVYKNGSEVLIDVTHRLSYTIGRATSAIGVCTPAFLADKACDRARFYGAQPKVHVKIQGSMFYI